MSLDDRYLDIKELSQLLKIHHTTVYRLVKRQRLPGFKVGADWRFSQQDIDDWIAQRQGREPKSRPQPQVTNHREMSQMLRPKEAGQLLRIGLSSVYKLIRENKLRAYYFNSKGKRMMRISRRDLDRYVASLPRTGCGQKLK